MWPIQDHLKHCLLWISFQVGRTHLCDVFPLIGYINCVFSFDRWKLIFNRPALESESMLPSRSEFIIWTRFTQIKKHIMISLYYRIMFLFVLCLFYFWITFVLGVYDYSVTEFWRVVCLAIQRFPPKPFLIIRRMRVR